MLDADSCTKFNWSKTPIDRATFVSSDSDTISEHYRRNSGILWNGRTEELDLCRSKRGLKLKVLDRN